MVDFVKKRLQVFVSSTYSDLIKERQAAVEAILVAGHIPAGMELFTAGDESQMDAIKQWIDESDVYLLILGGRYGSIEPVSGKSYTHLEYEYALEKNKPMFACVVTDAANERRLKEHGSLVTETENPKLLREFRNLATSKLVRFWDDSKDIKISIGETMAQFARRDDLVGWVRPHPEVDMGVLAAEIGRLSKENAELRASQGSAEHLIAGLRFGDFYRLLKKKNLLDFFIKFSKRYLDGYKVDFMEKDFCSQLIRLGLLNLTGAGQYVLTADGKQFVVRMELEGLNK